MDIYGIPPACRIYFDGLVAHFKKHKYQQADADRSIFHRHSAQGAITIAVSIDDSLVIATIIHCSTNSSKNYNENTKSND